MFSHFFERAKKNNYSTLMKLLCPQDVGSNMLVLPDGEKKDVVGGKAVLRTYGS